MFFFCCCLLRSLIEASFYCFGTLNIFIYIYLVCRETESDKKVIVRTPNQTSAAGASSYLPTIGQHRGMSSNMRQKDIRPAPARIEFKGMKFLITDRPSDLTIQNYILVSE